MSSRPETGPRPGAGAQGVQELHGTGHRRDNRWLVCHGSSVPPPRPAAGPQQTPHPGRPFPGRRTPPEVPHPHEPKRSGDRRRRREPPPVPGFDLREDLPVRPSRQFQIKTPQRGPRLTQRGRRILRFPHQMQEIIPELLLRQLRRVPPPPCRQLPDHADITFHRARRQPFQLDMSGETDYGRIGQFNRCFFIGLQSPTRQSHGNPPLSHQNPPAREALEPGELVQQNGYRQRLVWHLSCHRRLIRDVLLKYFYEIEALLWNYSDD